MKFLLLLVLIAAAGYAAAPGKPRVPENMMAAIPLHFEPNVGQIDARVSFTARGGGVSIFLTPEETVLARRGARAVRMKLRGSRRAKFEPFEKLPGVSNYYRGKDPKKWREGVPHYARVRAKSVYEGIDAVYYGNGRRLEYDFVVAPGADPAKIELAFEGAESMRIDQGGLVLVTKAGELRQRKPVVYQEVDGRRVEVAAEYRIREGSVRFELARFDAARPLVIDPILEYGTFVGGNSQESIDGLATDSLGAVYLSGWSASTDFPLSGAFDSTVQDSDAFVMKLNPGATSIVFSSFLGGSASDFGAMIALSGTGIFLTGETISLDFPMSNAIQNTHRSPGNTDMYMAGLNANGTLAFSTYWGGWGRDRPYGIAANANGVYIAGSTDANDFPGLPGTAQRAFVLRLALNGASVQFTKGLAGADSFKGIALDSTGNVYLAGESYAGVSAATTPGAYQSSNKGQTDAIVAKLSANGDNWLYVTNLGGEGVDRALAITTDSQGRAHVTGQTASSAFPLKDAFDPTTLAPAIAGFMDGFVAALDSAGAALVYSSYLGGDAGAWPMAILSLPGGETAISGATWSQDFPLASAWQSVPGRNAFLMKLSPAGKIVFSTYFFGGLNAAGPNAYALAPAPSGQLYMAGTFFWGVSATSFPGMTTPGALDSTADAYQEGFLARFSDGPPPVPVTITSVPTGRKILVDGRLVTTPVVQSWQPGTIHRLDANSPQQEGPAQYTFSAWSQGGNAAQTLLAPAVSTTYTALYDGTPCVYRFFPGSIMAGFEGGDFSTYLDTAVSCQWTPSAGAAWVALASAQTVTGPSRIDFRLPPNPGPSRAAVIAAGGVTMTVTQGGSSAALPAPSILVPAPSQTIQTKGTDTAWSAVPGAQGYEVRLVRTGAAQQTVYSGRQSGPNSTSTRIDLPDGTYTLFVRACTAAGFGDANCGPPASRTLTVSLAAPQSAPAILTPAAGQVLPSSTNLISWGQVPGATSYEVTLANVSGVALQINTATLSTVFTMKSSALNTLTVRACQAACGPPATRTFQVQLPPIPQDAPPGLTGQITNGNTLNLSWNPVLGADLYRVQVVQPNSGPGGGALTVAAKQVSATSASLPVPAGAATVVLNACNGDGCGPASTIAVNPTGPSPSVPIVATPMPVVVADGPNITISWSRIAGDNGTNTGYRLYVGDLSRDGPALDVITKNNFYGAYLRAEGRRYDALVFATQNGITVTGPASGFMVAGTSAAAPLITSPTHNSTFKQGPFRLAWSPIPDAVRYQYYVARQGNAAAVLTGVTPGLFVDTSLTVAAPALHQAIVRACLSANASQCSPDSDAGWGPWSNVATGTTDFTITP